MRDILAELDAQADKKETPVITLADHYKILAGFVALIVDAAEGDGSQAHLKAVADKYDLAQPEDTLIFRNNPINALKLHLCVSQRIIKEQNTTK